MRRRHRRLLPYYAYLSAVVSALALGALVWGEILLGVGVPAGLIRAAFVVTSLHLAAVAVLVLADVADVVRVLRVVCRAQRMRWGWSRKLSSAIAYRDSPTWWKTVVGLTFLPTAVWLLVAAAITES
jgi:hypothetical protein